VSLPETRSHIQLDDHHLFTGGKEMTWRKMQHRIWTVATIASVAVLLTPGSGWSWGRIGQSEIATSSIFIAL
jgi:hypothetical protein